MDCPACDENIGCEWVEQAKKSLKIMEGEFAKLITEAQELGEISKEREPA